jgi:hypothetical protein
MQEYKIIFEGKTFDSSGIITYNPNEDLFTYKFTVPIQKRKEFEAMLDQTFTLGLGYLEFRMYGAYFDLLGAEYEAVGNYNVQKT